MRKIIYITGFIGICFLVSCATFFNTNQQRVSFIANRKDFKDVTLKEGYLLDSFTTKTTVTKQYLVKRSRSPLSVELKTDSSVNTYILKAKYSPAYWWNIPMNYGVGILVDRFAPPPYSMRRFGYPSRNYFSLEDSAIQRKSWVPFYKGQIGLRIGYYLNNEIAVQYNRYQQSRTGSLAGLSIGADYYTKQNQYISVDAGTASTYVLCDICAFPDTTNKVSYLSVRNNHVLWGQIDLGYGISMSHYSTYFQYQIFKDIHSYTLADNSFGLSLFAGYRITPYFRMGFLWQPNIYTFTKGASGFTNQNYSSFNINFIIPVKR
jgi:hypothetical protein